MVVMPLRSQLQTGNTLIALGIFDGLSALLAEWAGFPLNSCLDLRLAMHNWVDRMQDWWRCMTWPLPWIKSAVESVCSSWLISIVALVM